MHPPAVTFFWAYLMPKVGIVNTFLEGWLTYYRPLLCNIPEEWRFRVHCGRSL